MIGKFLCWLGLHDWGCLHRREWSHG
ncbi:hypothetical protein LCGC14_2101680, partial [marine sediment metagenome]